MKATLINQLKSILLTLEQKNVISATRSLEDVQETLADLLQPHWSIRAEDEQYEDPDMWEYGPLHDLVSDMVKDLNLTLILCYDENDLNPDDWETVEDVIQYARKRLVEL